MKEKMQKSPTRWLRAIGLAEGLSYLALLGIAMPLKYIAAIPEPVKIIGWIHGVLFMLFIAAAVQVKFTSRRSFPWMLWAFVASVLPFGTFVLDRQLRKEERQSPENA